jgi:hypothetical protein
MDAVFIKAQDNNGKHPYRSVSIIALGNVGDIPGHGRPHVERLESFSSLEKVTTRWTIVETKVIYKKLLPG